MEAFMGYNTSSQQEYTDFHTYDPSQVVGAFDWASKLAGVKNQGSCGSCWAFSAIGALEPRYHITNKKKDRVDVEFSEQQLVDCDTRSSGCNGGLMTYAFMYLQSSKFMKSADYPYTARRGTCKADASKGIEIIKGYKTASGSHDALVSAAQEGPVSVAVDASVWSGYRGGVLTSCGTRLNHGVTFVGFDGSSAYKIRNSWGAGWGEAGHIRLAKGNTCGVYNDVSYPIF
jgi:C1A family cysteine protease